MRRAPSKCAQHSADVAIGFLSQGHRCAVSLHLMFGSIVEPRAELDPRTMAAPPGRRSQLALSGSGGPTRRSLLCGRTESRRSQGQHSSARLPGSHVTITGWRHTGPKAGFSQTFSRFVSHRGARTRERFMFGPVDAGPNTDASWKGDSHECGSPA